MHPIRYFPNRFPPPPAPFLLKRQLIEKIKFVAIASLLAIVLICKAATKLIKLVILGTSLLLRRIGDVFLNLFYRLRPLVNRPARIAPQIQNGRITEPPSLEGKFKPFRLVIYGETNFFKHAVEIFRKSLSKASLALFNDEWETMENISTISFAVIRAYLFSDSSSRFTFFTECISEKQTIDYTDQLLNLRIQLRKIPYSEQEIILDKTDFIDINQLPLSLEAKNILRKIGEISNKLSQNQRFLAVFYKIHQERK